MSTYTYEITKTQEYVEEVGMTEVYGIQISNANQKLARKKGESCRIDGISPVYREIEQFRALLEEMELYPVHLKDVVEDFLC